MKKFFIFIESLHISNQKSFYLAFLRVALSVWLLKELAFNWTSLDILYGRESFVAFRIDFLFQFLHLNSDFFHEHYKTFILFYVLFLSLNILGIGKNFTALLVYLSVELFQRLNHLTLNGGDNLIKFMLLYLVFANSYEYFTFSENRSFTDISRSRISNLLSNLASYSIMLHLCLAYFIAGIAKAHSEVWYNGVATYYTLSLDRFKGTSFNTYLANNGWFVLFSSYFTILLELYFPVLIWIKKFRIPLILMGIGLHMGIYLLMMIYGFQFIFLLAYGAFFTDEEVFRFRDSLVSGLKTFTVKIQKLALSRQE